MGKGIYDKIENHKRSKLIDLVLRKGMKLIDASRKLNINYSSAKTILRIYKKEKRIFKKDPPSTKRKVVKLQRTKHQSQEKVPLYNIVKEIINVYLYYRHYLMNEISRQTKVISYLSNFLEKTKNKRIFMIKN